jgi:hypothetical protein
LEFVFWKGGNHWQLKPLRLADDWWLVLICFERKILVAGCWWLVFSERKILLAGG